MPSLVEERYTHKSCAAKNKLFIIAGSEETCEVYSSHCNKFELLTCPRLNSLKYGYGFVDGAIFMGREIVVLFGSTSKYLVYDVEKDVWTEKPIPLLGNVDLFSCVKMSQC